MTQTWDEIHPPEATTTERTGAGWRATWAAIPLRLMLGIGFMVHGFPKIFSMEGNASFAATLGGIGVPFPEVMAWAIGLFEFFGGVALVLGLLVVPIAVLGIAEMLVAMFTLHLEAGFNFMNIVGMGPEGPEFGLPGYEVNLLYIAGFLALVFTGAGPASIDRSTRRTRGTPPSGRVGMHQPAD